MSAYLIFIRDKTLDAREMAAYAKAAAPTLDGHEAKVLSFYGPHIDLEGGPTEGAVIIEFPDTAAAKAWYHSPAYQAEFETAHSV
jgi:uncharacterized protein (DUF1330 family)